MDAQASEAEGMPVLATQRGDESMDEKSFTIRIPRRWARIGLVALPFYVLFELLAPLVELAGLVLVPLGVLIGAVDADFLWRFLLAAYAYAMVVSLVSVAVEEYAYHRFSRWRDLWGAVVGVVVENIGYRQFTAWWRLRGIWDALHRSPQEWGSMKRSGSRTARAPPAARCAKSPAAAVGP